MYKTPLKTMFLDIFVTFLGGVGPGRFSIKKLFWFVQPVFLLIRFFLLLQAAKLKLD